MNIGGGRSYFFEKFENLRFNIRRWLGNWQLQSTSQRVWNYRRRIEYLMMPNSSKPAPSYIDHKQSSITIVLAKGSRKTGSRTPERSAGKINSRSRARTTSSEEAIKAGEKIALAAFSSGLKLAAAFGTVAAKTAGLALESLASGADKFSELVKEEALRSYDGRPSNPGLKHSQAKKSTRAKTRKRPSH